MKGIRSKLDYILKHNAVLNKIFKFFASGAIKFMGLFIPMDEKAILFSAHSRKYNDSPRAVYEALISNPEYSGYKFFWAIEEGESANIPGNCTVVKPDTLKYFKTALKCKYWVTCVNIERGLKFKRKKCVYLNTWHGIPVKTGGNGAKGRKDYDFSYVDFFCISGEYEREIHKYSFNLKDSQIIKTGMPRNDELYHALPGEVEKIKEKMGLPKDKKIILYAPTWRDSKNGGKSYEIKPPVNFDLWEKELGEEYVVLLRTHPYTNKLLGVEFNDFVRDFSTYPSINELMKVSDILISDYSAIIFDYSILEKPIICFAYDLEEYKEERGLELDIEKEMPGGVVFTEGEVIAAIKNTDYKKECEKTKLFKEKYIEYGGHAAEQCIDFLLKK